ncbi:uncharacterized protein Bfra_011484 [Botrytis fragariae]|uniref:Uncharacterized protein n=1 Tax=Botrytis fragariae TaxID=1964551 RepID=A0A8H6AY49_9HELO|nr:uncharacterized protein Bfra_011484 [Botrytis fragariae]KAF5875721.1 hypothetical protein Bfra_011484 [Botrytis fragariae]
MSQANVKAGERHLPTQRGCLDVPAPPRGGQKQMESSCPSTRKVANLVNNQGTATVRWSNDEEKKKREVVIPKKKIVYQQTPDSKK